MKRITVAVMLVATGAMAEIRHPVVYSNDFSVRESRRIGILPGAWAETPSGTYPSLSTGSPYAELCDSVGKWSTSVHSSMYSAFDAKSYDGWYVPYLTQGVKLYFRAALISSEDTNPVATFSNMSNQERRSQVCLHSIGNAFTNGIVRVQADMRAPDAWENGSTSLQAVRIGPVFRKFMPVMAWGGANKVLTGATPGCAGIARSTNWDNVQTLYTSAGKGDKYLLAKNKWYRIVADYDLDRREYSVSAYDLGGAHPTFDTVGELKSSWPTNIPFVASHDGLDGALAGICVNGQTLTMMGANFTSTTNKLFTDNIAVSWKATGSDEFVRCYENDFATCRIRRVSTPETVGVVYSAPSVSSKSEVSTFTGYKSHGGGNSSSQVQFLPASLTTPIDSAVQPIGLDGWRRLAYDSHATGYLYSGGARDFAGDAGVSILIGGSDRYVMPVQSLGERITSGKIRFTVDARVPVTDVTAVSAGSRSVFASLGSASLYTATSGAIWPNVLTMGGMDVGNPVNSVYPVTPFCKSADSKITGAGGATSKWYRFETIADMDLKTYDFTITEIGSTGIGMADAPSGSQVFSRTGVSFASTTASDIGSFALHGYGHRDDTGNYPAFTTFDNIGVWKGYGTGSEKMIYSNDFSCCRRDIVVERASTYLSNQYNLDDGDDGWLRMDGLSGATRYTVATLRGTANKCICLGSETTGSTGYKARYTQPLAFDLSGLPEFTFRADIRPPQLYSASDGFAYLELTGRRAELTAVRAGFDDDVSVRIGFDSVAAYDNAWKSKLHGADGTAINMGNWYRFFVKVSPAAKTCRIRVYDQGPTQPEMLSPRGALVAEMDDVPFVDSSHDGITSISVVGSRMPYLPAGDADNNSAGLLVDNISISLCCGSVFILR